MEIKNYFSQLYEFQLVIDRRNIHYYRQGVAYCSMRQKQSFQFQFSFWTLF